MSNIILPNELIHTIILDYMTIYDNKFINSKLENHRKKYINTSFDKIKKILKSYIIKRKFNIEYFEDSYYIPKKYWKLYYPLSERRYFLKLVIKQNNLQQKDQIITIYNQYIKNPKNNLTNTFNKIINLLDNDELFNIGW